MSRKRHLLVAALTVIALLSTTVLSAGLSTLRLAPIAPPPAYPSREHPEEPAESAADPEPQVGTSTLGRRDLLPFIILAFAVLVLVISLFVTPEGRTMLIYALLLLMFVGLLLILPDAPAGQPAGPHATTTAEGPPVAASPEPTYEPPPWLIQAISMTIALLVVGAAAYLAIRLLHRPGRPLPPDALSALAEEARQALQDIQAGHNLQGTIVRCYQEMGEIIRQHRGIRRDAAMTPQEFARGMQITDLPQTEIWRITRLFERVRYSHHPPGQEEEVEATSCLQTIIEAVARASS